LLRAGWVAFGHSRQNDIFSDITRRLTTA
jgi:hypothetical protein